MGLCGGGGRLVLRVSLLLRDSNDVAMQGGAREFGRAAACVLQAGGLAGQAFPGVPATAGVGGFSTAEECTGGAFSRMTMP